MYSLTHIELNIVIQLTHSHRHLKYHVKIELKLYLIGIINDLPHEIKK